MRVVERRAGRAVWRVHKSEKKNLEGRDYGINVVDDLKKRNIL